VAQIATHLSSRAKPFCILNVVGDVLDDGELCFVEAAQPLDAAKARVQSLAEFWPVSMSL